MRPSPTMRFLTAAGLFSLVGGMAQAASTPASPATAELPAPLAAELPRPAKKPISHDVYANWRSIAGSVLSRNGSWVAYALVAQEADGEVVVRHLADGREWRAPRGSAPAFSADGRYLAFAIQPTRAELDQAKKEKKKGDDLPKPGAGLMDLASGKVDLIARVKSYAWPEQGASVLALLLAPLKETKDAKENNKDDKKEANKKDGSKKKEPGTELLVLDASNGTRTSIPDVAEVVWAKNGKLLAYAVSVKDATKTDKKSDEKPDNKPDNKAAESAREGVYLFNPLDASVRPLLAGTGHYKNLIFDDAGQQLAFVSNRDQLQKRRQEQEASADKTAEKEVKKEPELEPLAFSLFYWRDGDTDRYGSAKVAANTETPGMPAGWSASEHAEISFSQDGQRLFFGTAELPKPAAKEAPEPIKVDLWHWKDPELQSMQKVKAEQEKQRSYRAVLHLPALRLVQLANKEIPQVIVNDNPRFAMGSSDLPYQMLQSWDALYQDAYAVDLQTGAARLLAKKLRFAPTLSPAGKYLLAFDAASSGWVTWASKDGAQSRLTDKLNVRFEDLSKDTPEPRVAYGFAGWTADDASVVIYDQFDLWDINPLTHASRNLTAGFGRKNKLELRFVKLDLDAKEALRAQKPVQSEEPAIPETKALPTEPWILSATHEASRASGYYRQDPQGGAPLQLIHADKMISGLIKARQADRVLFTQQSFTEFPDLWSGDLRLHAVQKISAANPQQSHYNWGRQEIIEYTSADGKKLKALLAKPENFDPAKKYPMMVYIYEKMSDNLHKYIPPAPAQNINVTRYVSNGYIVLRPDIVYQTGYPGKSAMRTVLPAIRQVIAKGYVDPKRVGIQGHSWGAYQINYLITHSNTFRAAEAGAAMADMVSGYGGIRWGTGMSRAFQYEKQQSRIAGTPWDSTAKFIANSPIFAVDKVQTPYLTIHNDEDDAVPYYQAIEFFTALRRLGKEAYWFNYNGEKHGLKERDNMKHYTVHMSEFFDHYLLGNARPEWMTTPVPYLERGKRDVMEQFKTLTLK
ncbi:MAG: prolyl oligopeptidase family serine peptidase [Undibacterium sp.]|uniref:S9 family peptidase n=1 Tax=Undibacterium sp. TaxID=1914977 RepID=UPI0027220EF9|nr:prolyl oligopeptidase family serine peptidase [Undibacterium sp.]MDO8652592.1 prolyl oligopeptidase family serine peptidase [Undibacterium sp.]